MERTYRHGPAFVLYVVVCLLLAPGCAVAAQPSAEAERDFSAGRVRKPEAIIGHEVGADYKLARYQKIREYFEHVAKNSRRVNVREIGLTAEGRQMIVGQDDIRLISQCADKAALGVRHRQTDLEAAPFQRAPDELGVIQVVLDEKHRQPAFAGLCTDRIRHLDGAQRASRCRFGQAA